MSVYPLSFSKMNIFSQCEYRYERQYVRKDVKDTGHERNIYGNRVHKSFEQYCKSGAPLTDDLLKFQPLLDRIRSAEGINYYEHRMAVDENKRPVDYWDKRAQHRGLIDVANIKQSVGSAIDYKAGKPKHDEEQLKYMAAFMLSAYPKLQEVRTKYLWLFHPDASSEVCVYTRDMLPDLWAHFDRKAERMQTAEDSGVFTPSPSGLCPWCPAYNVCEYARRK